MTEPQARSVLQRRVFVDASAFFAHVHDRDQHHSAAVAIASQIRREQRPLITTDLVVAETHALVLGRVGCWAAQVWLDALDVPILFVDTLTYDTARELLRRYSDKNFSLTDAVSFVVMERLGIRQAFSFDEHFRQSGLEVLAPEA